MSKKHDKDFLMSRKYATFVANEYAKRIEKALEILKDTNVDMPETLLIETIDYARHILQGEDKDE